MTCRVLEHVVMIIISVHFHELQDDSGVKQVQGELELERRDCRTALRPPYSVLTFDVLTVLNNRLAIASASPPNTHLDEHSFFCLLKYGRP